MRFRPRPLLAVASAFGLVIALGVTGCGNATKSGSSDERPRIGVMVQGTTLDFARELSQGFHAGAQMVGGVEPTVTGPPMHDAARQIALFKELTTKAKGGIAITPSAPDLLARPVADAVDNGIPVIAVAGGRTGSGDGVKLLIENDNYELGRVLADEAIKRLPPGTSGKIVLGNNVPALPALEQRAKGMRDRFAQKQPNVRVVGPFDTQKDPRANQTAWQALVTANPDALAFLGTGDVDAVNLASVRAGTKGTWLAGGFNVDSRILRGIQDGQLFASVSGEHYLRGALAGWLLAEHAKSGAVLPQGWLVPSDGLVVTSANVDEIVQRQSSEANKLAWFRPQIDRIKADIDRYLRPLEQVR